MNTWHPICNTWSRASMAEVSILRQSPLAAWSSAQATFAEGLSHSLTSMVEEDPPQQGIHPTWTSLLQQVNLGPASKGDGFSSLADPRDQHWPFPLQPEHRLNEWAMESWNHRKSQVGKDPQGLPSPVPGSTQDYPNPNPVWCPRAPWMRHGTRGHAHHPLGQSLFLTLLKKTVAWIFPKLVKASAATTVSS